MSSAVNSGQHSCPNAWAEIWSSSGEADVSFPKRGEAGGEDEWGGRDELRTSIWEVGVG